MTLRKIGRLFFPAKQPVDPAVDFNSSPDPREIVESGRPESKFQGLNVAWKLSIYNMHDEIGQNAVLVLTTFMDSPANIWIVVDVEQFPEIYTCASGSIVGVEGKVSKVQGQDIYLENCRLKLLKEAGQYYE